MFLRCFQAYRTLLARLGSERGVELQPRLEIPLARPGGELHVLRRSGLPAPLHLAGALLRYRFLSLRERLGAVRAAVALGQLDPRAPELDRQTLGAWLAVHGQSPHATAALWDLIALPALNLPAGQASLALAAFVFKDGLLEHADAGDIGFHRLPQSEIVGEPAARALRAVGVDVRLGAARIRWWAGTAGSRSGAAGGRGVRRSWSPGWGIGRERSERRRVADLNRRAAARARRGLVGAARPLDGGGGR